MIIRKLALYLIFISYSQLIHATDEAGFDEICAIYTEALNSNMSKQQRNIYIFKNIATRINNPDAIDAHGSVFQLPAKDRYLIFKQGAELSLSRPWGCSAMQKTMK